MILCGKRTVGKGVSYALIISSLVLMTRLIIILVNIIVLYYVPNRTPKTMEYSRCHTICHNAICCDLICD